MVKIKFSFALLLVLFFVGNAVMSQTNKIVAFPGAEGFGKFSTGGRGGDVYHVTNLNDSGNGSLRNGISSANGPRTIVFDLSGNIMLKSPLKIDKPNITIAGQTAPGEGITLGGGCLKINADNIVVRYLRSRLGDQGEGDEDAITISGGTNIIFDHLSASWSIDETLSCQSATADSITVQWCMITESLFNSHHAKGPHGMGGIVGSRRQTFHHNLYAHHNSRNPKVTGRRHCEVDFRNNVIYNWASNSCYDGTASWVNWVNNYYKAGPATKSSVRGRIFEISNKPIEAGGINSPDDSEKYETSFFVEGNYVDGFPAITLNNWNGGIDYMGDASEAKNRAKKPFDFPKIIGQTAKDAYKIVLPNAGASLVRDVIDKRIVNEVESGTVTYGKKGIIDSQKEVGGWPALKTKPAPLDSDQDGMPDAWEKQNGLDPKDPADRNGDRNKDGYTNLEEYLNSLVPTNF
ncbi:MAG: pectate lyase [Prolixibacteraceae bacterium]